MTGLGVGIFPRISVSSDVIAKPSGSLLRKQFDEPAGQKGLGGGVHACAHVGREVEESRKDGGCRTPTVTMIG
jgi:hypothetical protein